MKSIMFSALLVLASTAVSAQTAIVDLTTDGYKVDVMLYETDKEPVEIGTFNMKEKPVFMKRLITLIDSYKLNGYTLTAVTESKYILEKLPK